MADRLSGRRVAFAWVAAVLGSVCLRLLVEAGGPIASDDLWWHLSLGRAYLLHGPWLDADPLLFSANAAPAPHSWLFDLALAGIAKGAGLGALRVVHVMALAGIVALAYVILRREARSGVLALAATAVLLVLMANRIGRLRPDLCSIAATYGLYRLLLEPREAEGPLGWWRVAGAALLLALWANLHALVAIGPLLVAVALLADCGAWWGGRWRLASVEGARSEATSLGVGVGTSTSTSTSASASASASADAAGARRLAWALGSGLVAACANPLGSEQLLSYVHARGASALSAIVDDWAPFDPLHFNGDQVALDRMGWLAVDALLLGFLLVAGRAVWRWWQRPNESRLRALAPRLAALSAAALVAMALADRFLWLALFPLLYLLHAAQGLETPRARRAARMLALAFAAVVGLSFVSRWDALVGGGVPAASYFDRNVSAKYPSDCVRFIADAGLEGRLFSRYALGGFAGYWLAPRVKTWVNGSMNFDAAHFDDYFAVAHWRGGRSGESVRAILERQGVDLYLGSGLPAAKARKQMNDHSSADLAADPHYLRVYRTPECSVSLRRSPSNTGNLARVRAWYRTQGVPFDARRGFEIRLLLAGHLDWAIAQRMVPTHYAGLKRLADARPPAVGRGGGKGHRDGRAVRVYTAALDTLATLHLLLGDPADALAFEARLAPRVSSSARSLRRRIDAELQLGRVAEARESVRVLKARLGDSPRVEAFDAAVRVAERIASGKRLLGQVRRIPLRVKEALERRIRSLPVVDMAIYKRLIRHHLAAPLPIPPPRDESRRPEAG